MKDPAHFHPSDLRGVGRLAIDATLGITDLVEALHHSIASVSPPLGKARPGRTKGITGFVHGAVRGVTGLVGSGMDAVLARLVPELSRKPSSKEREAVLAALNGVLGDYLARTGNPLAIAMSLRHDAAPPASGCAAGWKRTARAYPVSPGACASTAPTSRSGPSRSAPRGP